MSGSMPRPHWKRRTKSQHPKYSKMQDRRLVYRMRAEKRLLAALRTMSPEHKPLYEGIARAIMRQSDGLMATCEALFPRKGEP